MKAQSILGLVRRYRKWILFILALFVAAFIYNKLFRYERFVKDFNGYPAFCEIDNLTGEAVVEFTNGATFRFTSKDYLKEQVPTDTDSEMKMLRAKDFVENLTIDKFPDIETRKDPLALYKFITSDIRSKRKKEPYFIEGLLSMKKADFDKTIDELMDKYVLHPKFQVIVDANGATRQLQDIDTEKLWRSLNQKTTTPEKLPDENLSDLLKIAEAENSELQLDIKWEIVTKKGLIIIHSLSDKNLNALIEFAKAKDFSEFTERKYLETLKLLEQEKAKRNSNKRIEHYIQR